MGMYTETFVNTDLKHSTPPEVLDVLRAMCDHESDAPALQDKPRRWGYLFTDGSYYTPRTSCAMLTYDGISGQYSLLAKGDTKNYENEIQQFFDFIKPWCESDFIGYYRYDESREPTLVYSGCNGGE